MGKIELELIRAAVVSCLSFGGAGCTAATEIQNPNGIPTAGNPAIVEPTIPPTIISKIPIETVEPTAAVDNRSQILLFGNKLLYTWNIFEGNPIVDGRELILPGSTDIQSEGVFSDGILRGEISSVWVPQSESSNSSIGFERWWSNCHYGVLFKTNGHLAVFRPQPGIDRKCTGDLLDQNYLPIPNWDTIRTGGVISFTLSWSPKKISLQVSSNGKKEQVSYSGPTIPDVPLGIRLYAQEGETYGIKTFSYSSN